MKYLSVLFVMVFVVSCVFSAPSGKDNGFYIPKSFYVIDSAGHRSPLSIIGHEHQQQISRLHRRSAPQYHSSSSSSSSSSSNGGPVYFHHTSSHSNGPSGGSSQQGSFANSASLGSAHSGGPSLSSSSNFAGGQSVAGNNYGGGGGGGSASIGGLDSRFGGDNDNYSPQPQVFVNMPNQGGNNGNGVFTATSGIIFPNGEVKYQTQTGKY